MDELEKYLYCIIRCHEERSFDAAPIASEGSMVHTVCCNGLAAVVSDSLAKQYEGTRRNMMAHERVLEAVMQEFTLLPVRFGTVTDSSSPIDDIQKLLAKRFEEFDALLKDMEGKVELSLKAFWHDEKAIFEEIMADNADIRRLRNSLAGKSPEATHFDRIRLGEMVKQALGHKRANEAAKILLPFRRLAYKTQENEVMVDRMVVNAAFLVGRSREPEFDGAARQLDEDMGERVALRYFGPVPPYNFVSIVVNWNDLK